MLGEQLSASLRDSLIEQLAAIKSVDEAAAWAHRNMPAKNKLAGADAKMVEERFQARLLKIDQQVSAKEGAPASGAPAKMLHGSAPGGLPHEIPTQSRASAGVAVTLATQNATAGTSPIGRKRSPSSSVQALASRFASRPSKIRAAAGLPRVRPRALRPASTPRTRTQGKRRVHRPQPRVPPLWQASRMAARIQHRSRASGAKTMAAHALGRSNQP